MFELMTVTCKRCGHSWAPRVPNPQTCAKCRSPYWNIERKRRTPASPEAIDAALAGMRDDLAGLEPALQSVLSKWLDRLEPLLREKE